MPCDACGCACGEACEEAELEAPLLDSYTAVDGHIAAPPSTGICITWETVRSPFVSASPEEERDKVARCMCRALAVLLWLFVVDAFRGQGGMVYFVAILMAFFIFALWSGFTAGMNFW